MGNRAGNILQGQATQNERQVPGDLGLLSKTFLEVTSLVERSASLKHWVHIAHSTPERILSVHQAKQ